MKIGLDAIAFDVAKIHLPIKTLATARNIEADKLEKGLGLLQMTLPDWHQDVVVFGANALTKLILENEIDLRDIARIYVGTESSIDNRFYFCLYWRCRCLTKLPRFCAIESN